MNRAVTIKTIEQNDNVSLYSICFDSNNQSEFEKFVEKFKDEARIVQEYKTIIFALSKIMTDGVLERLFRPEGKYSDNVCALSINTKMLRLYCLRISDQILILGNGGIKTTKTYEEDQELAGYVLDLQRFDELLKQAQKTGSIKIEKNIITNIEEQTFTI